MRWSFCLRASFTGSKVTVSISSLLSRLKSCKDVETGRKLHAEVVESGAEGDIHIINNLVSMYSTCGYMSEARKVFESLQRRNVKSWNFLLQGYVANGEAEVAVELFSRWTEKGDENCVPDSRSFFTALRACSSLAVKEDGVKHQGRLVKVGSLEKGMYIHSKAVVKGYELDTFVATSLVDMYARCGTMVDAQRAFDRVVKRDLVLWTGLISGYVSNGEPEQALHAFSRLITEPDCAPDARVFLAALTACSGLAEKETGEEVNGKVVKVSSLERGLVVHSYLVGSGCKLDVFVAAALVEMYSRCGSLTSARRVYELMPCHNVVVCTSLVQGYTESQEEEVALELFLRVKGFAADAILFVAALKACTGLACREQGELVGGKLVKALSLRKAREIHREACESGVERNVFVFNTLIDLYGKCGSMKEAEGVLNKRGSSPTVVSWTALISGYAENEQEELALKVFFDVLSGEMGVKPDGRMLLGALCACTRLAAKEQGIEVEGRLVKPETLKKAAELHSEVVNFDFQEDIFVTSALMDLFCKCGSMIQARDVFNRIKPRSVVTWTTLILGYAENGQGELGLKCFSEMILSGCSPDVHAFAAALKASGSSVSLPSAKNFHSDVSRRGLFEKLSTGLVDCYSKCGSIHEAQLVFDCGGGGDSVSWTALLGGYSRQGDAQRVFELYRRMQEERVHGDGVTLLCVLTACCHAGLVEEGWRFFTSRCSSAAWVDHYTCAVDMLGRANRLEAGVEMVQSNVELKDNVVAWRVILAACRKWKNESLGRIAFENLVRVDESDNTADILFAGTCSNPLKVFKKN